MRIFIHEHYCGGGLVGQALPSELLAAGSGMLRNLVEDFHAAGHDVTVLVDERVPLQVPGRIIAIDAASPQRAVDAVDRALAAVDAAVVVAPEHGELLPAMLERIERAGVVNLGSTSVAVRFVSDKHALAQRLAAAGLEVPCTALGFEHATEMLEQFGEIIMKPNRGAGCVDTHVCRTAADVAALPRRGDWLVQQRVPGLAASVAFILPRSGRPIPLRAGLQAIGIAGNTRSGRLDYFGGRLPLDPALESRAIRLGEAALHHLEGLHGFVGIDLILGERPEQDTLIEVNARPTVAYAALRRLALFRIPDLMVGDPVRVDWRPGSVRYQADGTCEMLPSMRSRADRGQIVL